MVILMMMMRKWTFDFHYIDYIDNSLSCLPPIQDSIFIISLFLPRDKRSETLKMLSIGNKKKNEEYSFIHSTGIIRRKKNYDEDNFVIHLGFPFQKSTFFDNDDHHHHHENAI